MYRCNAHSIIRFMCLFTCATGLLAMAFLYGRVRRATWTELRNVSLHSEDSAIMVRWDSPDWSICDYVEIQIADDNGVVYKEAISPLIGKLSYRNGEHGKLYTVSASAHYRDGSYGERIEGTALFLDYGQLPSLPLMMINTYSGDDPTYSEAKRPDNSLWGSTMVDNMYLRGEMVMSGGVKEISMGVDIRVRGNTSSVGSDKKSYKIRLDEPYDLLGRVDGRSCKEWVLLNNGMRLNTYIGDYVGGLCGMEWQPQMMFVNVILNGDWKGCYCLTEAVCLESSYGLVSETGYIFENDAYWWNSEGLYFKTDSQAYQMGYTFKYPEFNSSDEEAVLALRDYMQEFEDRILHGDASYRDYIEEGSYTSWILARDIMGNADGGGSNMYFYKYDFDGADPTSSKVKMGPLWDFDGAFRTTGRWSDCRSGTVSYFPQLFEQDIFYDRYRRMWEGISQNLYSDIKMLLDDLDEAYGEDIDMSWQLEGSRRNVEIDSFNDQKERALDWFLERIAWMDEALQMPATDP